MDPDREEVDGPGEDGERVVVVARPRLWVPHLHQSLYTGSSTRSRGGSSTLSSFNNK